MTACSHSAMPSAVWTPMPCMKSCSANSPSFSSLAISSVTSSPAVTAWNATTSSSPLSFGPEEVGEADAVVAGLARGDEALEHRLAVLGVEDDDLVALGVAGEVADLRPRVQVGLLAPHALQARLEVLADELLPRLALHAAPAPVELEEHVGVEVRVDLVEVDVDLAARPRTAARGSGRRCARRERTVSSSVGGRLGLGALLAQLARRPRASSRRAPRAPRSSTIWSILFRPSKASLQ